MPTPVVVDVPARAALAGNPSDLYGGAVLAVPVPSLRARVEVQDSAATEVDGVAEPLVRAALARAGWSARVTCTTSIPRAVGLAGSSAIVIATLRAVEPALEPMDLALLAQAVEADLGIVAGLQDRVVQAYGCPVLVDVAGPRPTVTPLIPRRPISVLVAWLPTAAADSGAYHRALRETSPAGMAELGDIARRAAAAFADADVAALVDAVGASAELRSRIAPLSDAHERLAAAVAATGLVPNSAGSGGSVAAVASDGDTIERARAAVRDLGGDAVVEVYR